MLWRRKTQIALDLSTHKQGLFRLQINKPKKQIEILHTNIFTINKLRAVPGFQKDNEDPLAIEAKRIPKGAYFHNYTLLYPRILQYLTIRSPIKPKQINDAKRKRRPIKQIEI